jgi:hypothetical protein
MAEKSLDEMLEERISRADETTRRVAIMDKHWDTIQGYYRKGHTYRFIWETMVENELIDFPYSSFIHFKEKRLRREREARKERERSEAKAENTAATADAKGRVGEVPPRPITQPKPSGSNRVDIQGFGQDTPFREKRRF